jgi:hypothetical protein
MQSLNNIFVAVGEPVRCYVKTVDYPITGWRIDPDTGKQVEFILSNPGAEFDYDSDVLELYSEKDVRFLQQRNRYLFEKGLLKEFQGEPEPVDMTNSLTDTEVAEIATIRLPNVMKPRLASITSDVSIRRILAHAKEIGRPAKVIELIETRLKELT